MTHVACEFKLRSVVRSSMHPCPNNRVAIERAVVYFARAAYTFSAGIKCRHCRLADWGSQESLVGIALFREGGGLNPLPVGFLFHRKSVLSS